MVGQRPSKKRLTHPREGGDFFQITREYASENMLMEVFVRVFPLEHGMKFCCRGSLPDRLPPGIAADVNDSGLSHLACWIFL